MSRPPVVPLRDAVRDADGLDGDDLMDRLTDPWMGARYIVHQGRRVYMTAGQLAALAALRFRSRLRVG